MNPFPLISDCIPGSKILLSETEALDKSSVSFDVLLCKVCKKLLSVTNHLGETSLRVEVLGVLLHVLGERVDAVGKDRDLYLGRAGVSFIDSVSFNESGFCFLGNHRKITFLFIFAKSACICR